MNIETDPTRLHSALRWPPRARVGKRRTRSGFTLMELVVASALMATLMVGLWGLVSIFASMANKGTAQLQRIRDATQFFQWLESDLRRVPDTKVRYTTPSLLGNESTLDLRHVASPSLEWLARPEQQTEYQQRRARQTGDVGMSTGAERQRPLAESGRFVAPEALAIEATAALPSVRRVRYRFQSLSQSLADSPTRSPTGVDASASPANYVGLWRYDERSAAGGERWLGSALQFTAVEAVRFSYYNGRRWAAQWNSAAQGGLPVAVRVEAWFAGGSALGNRLADDALDTSDQRPVVDEPMEDRSVRDQSATDQAAWSWVEALGSSESRALPDRRADLTRWVALR